MPTVLVVDDDRFFRESLRDGLSAQTCPAPPLTVLVAGSALEAVEILSAQPIDLLLTDLQMPETDGFELIARVSRTLPELPVLAMTGRLESGTAERAVDTGAWFLFEKPFELCEVRRRIHATLEARLSGTISGVTVAAFLQLLEMERKTCSLHVKSQGREGRFFLEEGRLVFARTGALTGRAAAYEMVTWHPADLVIDARPAPLHSVQERLYEGIQAIVLEAMRLADERSRARTG